MDRPASNENPYAPPLTETHSRLGSETSGPNISGRLVFYFTVDARLLSQRVTQHLNDSGAGVGAAVLLMVLATSIALATVSGKVTIVLAGYLLGAGVSLMIAWLWRRRKCRLFLHDMEQRFGIRGGVVCAVQVTATKLILCVDGQSTRTYSLQRLALLPAATSGLRRTSGNAPALVVAQEIVLPLPDDLECSGLHVVALVQLMDRRRKMSLRRYLRRQSCWQRLTRRLGSG